MSDFSRELVGAMISGSVSMLLVVWFIFTVTAKRWSVFFYTGIILTGWFAAALLLSQGGFFLKLSFGTLPNIGLLFTPLITGIIFLVRSISFQKIIDNIYQPWLITVQFLRSMGVVFLSLYAQGLMPAEFAIPSGVGDVVIGTTAPLVALFLYLKPIMGRKVAIVWNIVGFLDLFAAIVLGFFTSPTSYQLLALDRPNHLLFAFPLALVPTFAVPLSLLLHIFSLRVLLRKPEK